MAIYQFEKNKIELLYKDIVPTIKYLYCCISVLPAWIAYQHHRFRNGLQS